jgi:hypothetical protein
MACNHFICELFGAMIRDFLGLWTRKSLLENICKVEIEMGLEMQQ